MATAIFIVLSVITVGSAVAVVSLSNIFYAALALVLTLTGVAGLYALLGAGYLAVVQVLIYVGAISILIIFGIMVSEHFMGRRRLPFNEQWWVAAIVAAALFLVLGFIAVSTSWPTVAQSVPENSVSRLGEVLLGRYVLPFEVASLVLVASLIGAVYIARDR